MKPLVLLAALLATTVAAFGQLKAVDVTLRGTVGYASGAYTEFVGSEFTNMFTTSTRPFLDLNGSFLYSALTHITVAGTTIFQTANFQADYVEVWTGGLGRYGMTQSSRQDLGFDYRFLIFGSPDLVQGNHLRHGTLSEDFLIADGFLENASGSLVFSVTSIDVMRPIPEPSTYAAAALALIGLVTFMRYRRRAVS